MRSTAALHTSPKIAVTRPAHNFPSPPAQSSIHSASYHVILLQRILHRDVVSLSTCSPERGRRTRESLTTKASARELRPPAPAAATRPPGVAGPGGASARPSEPLHPACRRQAASSPRRVGPPTADWSKHGAARRGGARRRGIKVHHQRQEVESGSPGAGRLRPCRRA